MFTEIGSHIFDFMTLNLTKVNRKCMKFAINCIHFKENSRGNIIQKLTDYKNIWIFHGEFKFVFRILNVLLNRLLRILYLRVKIHKYIRFLVLLSFLCIFCLHSKRINYKLYPRVFLWASYFIINLILYFIMKHIANLINTKLYTRDYTLQLSTKPKIIPVI